MSNIFTSNNRQYYFYGQYSFRPDLMTILKDGHTIAYYDSTNLDTITKVGAAVSKITDVLQSGYDLEVGSCGYDAVKGFTFDGTQKISTLIKNTPQPFFVYIVFSQDNVDDNETKIVFDGFNFHSCYMHQRKGSGNPWLSAYAGSASPLADELGFGELGIVRCYFNGVASYVQINDTVIINPWNHVPWYGNLGNNSPNGFSLGHAASGAIINVKAVILRKSNSKEEVINCLLKEKFIKPLTFNTGKLCFTWDGDVMPDIFTGHEILKDNNIKDSLYLCTHGGGGSDNPAMWAIINQMYLNGTEIQEHGYDHVSFITLDAAGINANIDAMDATLLAEGFPVSNHLAYTYGYNNFLVRTTVIARKLTARGVRAVLLLGKPTCLSDLPAISLGNYTNTQEGLDKIKWFIDECVENNYCFNLYAHGVSYTSGQHPQQFSQICEHIRQSGIETLTISELYNNYLI